MTLLESMSTLLRYPDEGYHAAAARTAADATLETAVPLACFADSAARHSLVELQELYIQAFDLSPVCALELGWHLFGENYDRGIMLVRMRGLLEIHGIPESTELPDHITHALLLLDRMDDLQALDFAAACLAPALHKMTAALAGKNCLFEPLLEALGRFLYARFPELPLPEESGPPARVAEGFAPDGTSGGRGRDVRSPGANDNSPEARK